MKEIKDYLERNLSKSSAKIYLFEISHFIKYLGEERARSASYSEVMEYLNYLRSIYDNPSTIHRIIQSLKHYYYFLIEAGKRVDHPCRYLSIKDRSNNTIQLQDLLKEKELEKLLEHLENRKERYPTLGNRNKVILSLLIYQGLRVKEICQLESKDIDLEKGTIVIHPSTKINGRTLALEPSQILVFYKYIKEDRNELLKENKESTEKLIITKVGTAEKGEGIHYLVSTLRKVYPRKKISPTRLRQSVITNLLSKGNDLRKVQYFAGHKKPSSTEKYRQNNLEKLKESVNKYHPLD